MASDLASQLRSLAAKAGVEPRRLKGQPSLLHDSQTAADIGVDEIYDKAYEGTDYGLHTFVGCQSTQQGAVREGCLFCIMYISAVVHGTLIATLRYFAIYHLYMQA